jgi:chromosome segregation ATPase
VGRPGRGAIVLWVLALMVVGAGAGYMLTRQAQRFSQRVAVIEADKQALLEEGRKMQSSLKELETERGTLTQSAHTLTIDRDNLLAQAEKLLKTASERDASAKLHEQVLKRTAEENLALKEKLMPLEDEFASLQEHHEHLRKEYETLERELYEAKNQGQQKQLQGDLETERMKREADLDALRKTRQHIRELELAQVKTRVELSKVQERLGALQDKYTAILSENKSLAVRAKKVPAEVATLAHEHERLVKDLADTHYNMGVIFAKDEEYARAAKEFEMVVQLKPDDADAHYNLGLIYAEHIPDRGRAMEFFRKYLDINPGAKDASWVRQYIASWRAWDAHESLEP